MSTSRVSSAGVLVTAFWLLHSLACAENSAFFGSYVLAPGPHDPSGANPNMIWTFSVRDGEMVAGDGSLQAALAAQCPHDVQVVALSYGLSPTNYVVDDGFAFNTFSLDAEGSVGALSGSAQLYEHPLDVEADLFVTVNHASAPNEYRAAALAVQENSLRLPSRADALLSVPHVALFGGYDGIPFDAGDPSRVIGFDHHPPSTTTVKYFCVDRVTQLDTDGDQAIDLIVQPSDILKLSGNGGPIQVYLSHTTLGLYGGVGGLDYITSLAVDNYYYVLNSLPSPVVQFTLGPNSTSVTSGALGAQGAQYLPADHLIHVLGTPGSSLFRSSASTGTVGTVTSVDTIDPLPPEVDVVVEEIAPEEYYPLGSDVVEIVDVEVNGRSVEWSPGNPVPLPFPAQRIHLRLYGLRASGEVWSQGTDIDLQPTQSSPIQSVAVRSSPAGWVVSAKLAAPTSPGGFFYFTLDEAQIFTSAAPDFLLPIEPLPGHHFVRVQYATASGISYGVHGTFEVSTSIPAPAHPRWRRYEGEGQRYVLEWESAPAATITHVELWRGPQLVRTAEAEGQFDTLDLAQGRYRAVLRDRGVDGESSAPVELELIVGPTVATFAPEPLRGDAQNEDFGLLLGDLAYVPSHELLVVLHRDSASFDWYVLHGDDLSRRRPSTFPYGLPAAVTYGARPGSSGIEEFLAWIVEAGPGQWQLVLTDAPRVTIGDGAVFPVLQSTFALDLDGHGPVTALAYDAHGDRFLIARGGQLHEADHPSIPTAVVSATALDISATAVTAERDGCFSVPRATDDVLALSGLVDYRVEDDSLFSWARFEQGYSDVGGVIAVGMGRAAEKRLFLTSGSVLHQFRGRQKIEEVGVEHPFRGAVQVVLGDWNGDGAGCTAIDLAYIDEIIEDGAPIACLRAVDLDANGVIDLNDVTLTTMAFTSGLLPHCAPVAGTLSCEEECP